MKRILFVDDEPKILEGLQRMLRSQRREWDMRFAVGPDAALAELETTAFDVVVTDMRMPRMDGAALLGEVKRRFPATVRIILSGYSDSDAAARATVVAHQFLSKPCSADMLREAVNRAGTLKEEIPNDAVRELVGGIDALPPVPGLYQHISRMLSAPEPSLGGIVEVLGGDVGVSAKLLQLVNSSFFGIGRSITTVRAAVDLLGIRTVQTLVLSTEIFRTFSVERAMRGITADEMNSHSLAVGNLAKRMVGEPAIAEIAQSIGLLHDIGKLVLANRIPEQYGKVVRIAAEGGIPLHDAERDELGVTHAEVGAYLLRLWNLPSLIVDGVAEHHLVRDLTDPLTPGNAVYVANALVHEAGPSSRPSAANDRNAAILDHPGIAERLPAWRRMSLHGVEAR